MLTQFGALFALIVLLGFACTVAGIIGARDRKRAERRKHALGPDRNEHGYPTRS
jgi:hypothetical protein